MGLVLRTLPLFFAASLIGQTPAPATSGTDTAPPVTQQPAQGQSTTQTPLNAQQLQQPGNNGETPAATIRTNSRLVILDTVVLDRKDHIVTGLKKEDFHITEEDSPQTVLNFIAPGTFTPAADAAINSTADLDRLAPRAPVNIILLDEFNTLFQDMAFARYSLKKYLNKQPGKLDQPTMLIAVSLQKFEVLQDYTEDKGAILNALDHHFAAYPWQAAQFGWLAERYSQAFLSLQRVARATEGHPGHKNMIWIGRGFPNLNLANVNLDARQRIDSVVQETVNLLRDARVTLYTVDPAGLQIDPGAYGATGGVAEDPFGGSYEFNKLAQATGGRTFYGRNDVDAEIGTSIRDGANFYTLTYRPTGAADNPNKFRRIKITFDDPGYRAVTREGYYPERGPARYNPQGTNKHLFNELIAANISNMSYDGVPVSLKADPTDPDKFTVHVEARGLNWTLATETEPRHAEVMLLATSFDRKGKVVEEIARNIKVAASSEVAPTGRLERAIDFNVTLKHDPQAVRARFVVRVASTGRIGTADTALNPNQQAVAKPATAPTADRATPSSTSRP